MGESQRQGIGLRRYPGDMLGIVLNIYPDQILRFYRSHGFTPWSIQFFR
jgi:hypothetical protein